MLSNTPSAQPTRQKAICEKIIDMKSQVFISSPREDNQGNMYFCSHSGEVYLFTDGGIHEPHFTTGGQPNSVAFDSSNNFYIADISNSGVYLKGSESKELESYCRDYDGIQFKGPSSLAYNKEDNSLYICDSGIFGTTSLNKPAGSLFISEIDSYVLRPLLLNCLQHPSDVFYDPVRKMVYVAETYANRIIRLVQNPEGVYHASVFHQFNGLIGPTCLSMDELGNLYVGRFEYQNTDGDVDGIISVLGKEGNLVGELILPKMPEITGLFISSKRKDILYVTEKTCNGILKIKLTAFISEIDPKEGY